MDYSLRLELCQLLKKIDETRKSHIDQIRGNPYYVYMPSGHDGLFKHKHSKRGDDYKNGILLEPGYVIL